MASLSAMLTTLLTILAATIFYIVVRRVYFSPISHIPGPKLAAVSYLYQFYFDVYPNHGRFLWHCQELHKKYGRIIRIGPNEVHIHDPEFYTQMYTPTSRRRDKSARYFWMAELADFGGGSVFTTLGHDLHRLRRSALSPAFSKRRIRDLESYIRKKCLLLKDIALSRAETGKILELHSACSGLTLDVISEYCYGDSLNVLQTPEMGREFVDMFDAGGRIFPFARQFPRIIRILANIPKWIAKADPSFQVQARFEDLVGSRVRAAYEDAKAHDQNRDLKEDIGSLDYCVMHMLVQNEELPEQEKEYRRIYGEASLLIGAGMETTGRTMCVTLFHLLANPPICRRLLEELRTFMREHGSEPELTALEQLPYLSAVISEGLRLAHSQAGRLARVAPTEDLVYNGIHIPAGVEMAQSTYLLHTDADLWPQPFKFDPERFLETESKGAQNYFAPFSRGARACVGMNLAMAELYLGIAILVRGIRMELVDTSEVDVSTVEEYFTGYFPHDSKGIQVKVLGPQT